MKRAERKTMEATTKEMFGRDGRDGRDGHDDDDARKTMKGEGECVACPKKVARRRFSSGRAK